MKKKLTLDETWELCLKMWKWIADEVTAMGKQFNPRLTVESLKYEWMKENGYKLTRINHRCFLCEYDDQHINDLDHIDTCQACPARLVDSDFSCGNTEYEYDVQPLKFYAKLVELNKIRLAKK